MERLMRRKSNLLVCDIDNQSDNSIHDVIYWSSYTSSKSDGIFSIPQLIEESADYLKAKYLKLIYEYFRNIYLSTIWVWS
jgi:hypothetical protein